MEEKINFRPHHFLCAYCFKGKGYSTEFILNFSNIMAQLNGNEGDQTLIYVSSITDSICAPCPHRRNTVCETESQILHLDRSHAKVLGLVIGESLTWGEIKKRIEKNISKEVFETICASCKWKPLGICERALKENKNFI